MAPYFYIGAALLLRGVLSNIMQSESSTISAMCDNIVHSVSLLNKLELLKLVDRDRCKDHELLGESVLLHSQKNNNYCYGKLAPLLCGSKYTPVKERFNCEHIKKKFMSIMQGCLVEGESDFQDRNCSGLNMETFTVTDSLVFCRMNFISGKDGAQVSFKQNEIDDCQSLAQSYNHCQNIGRAFNHPHFCINGGYQGYCNYYMHKIIDSTYVELCRDVVLPFVFTNLESRTVTAPSSFCRTADVDMEKALLAKRDNLMERRQQILDQLESDSAVEAWKTDMEAKKNSVIANVQELVKLSKLASSNTHNFFRLPYNFDSLVRAEYSNVLATCEGIMKQASTLPETVTNTDNLIRNIDSLVYLDLKIQEALIQFKQLQSLVGSGSHSTIIPTKNYKPVDKNLLRIMVEIGNKLQEMVPKRLSIMTPFLVEHAWSERGMERISRDTANELQFLAELHESQLNSYLKTSHKRKGRSFSHSTNV